MVTEHETKLDAELAFNEALRAGYDGPGKITQKANGMFELWTDEND